MNFPEIVKNVQAQILQKANMLKAYIDKFIYWVQAEIHRDVPLIQAYTRKYVELAHTYAQQYGQLAQTYTQQYGQLAKTHTQQYGQLAQTYAQRYWHIGWIYIYKVRMLLAERIHKLVELWQEDTTYMVYVVPTNGKGMKQKNIHSNFLHKAVYGACALVVLGAVSFGIVRHNIVKNNQIQQELAEYHANKAQQEQKLAEMNKKLQELNKMTAKTQQDLANLAKVEEQVRQQMQKSGMHVPQKALNPSQYAGKGGNGDMSSLMTQINVAVEQNKNMHTQLKAETKDWQNLLESLKEENNRLDYTPNQWPLEEGYISSRFGGRRDPIYGGRDNHPGIDIAADYGTPIYAAGHGTIEHAGWYGGYGKFILIEHGNGYETAYGHLSSINVKPGQEVKKGDFIGRVGSTGYSTGPHLHFEVRQNGEQINPMKMF